MRIKKSKNIQEWKGIISGIRKTDNFKSTQTKIHVLLYKIYKIQFSIQCSCFGSCTSSHQSSNSQFPIPVPVTAVKV